MDELFERLEKCHMGNHYTCGLGYVDDFTQLAPMLSGLQIQIKICEEYADEFDIEGKLDWTLFEIGLDIESCRGKKYVSDLSGGQLH